MREIEFRGKCLDNGEWVKGWLTYNRLDNLLNRIDTKECCYCVIPETVGQYTGLKDKNGVKIFEGDILKPKQMNLHGLQAVCWDDFAAGFMFTKQGSKIGESRITEIAVEYCVVVGNIHDNPELLKERT